MGKDDEAFVVEGEASKKVLVHQMHEGKAFKVVAEYENEDEVLKHPVNLGRQEAVLVRRRDNQ